MKWRDDLPADHAVAMELRKRIEAFQDAGYGECWLRRPDIAQVVEDALLHFDGQRYKLLAWCVMPNHVHAMFEVADHPMSGILHTWKSFTAKRINQILERSGQVWMEDYFDRYVRDENHLESARRYIENNPVKAGLAEPGKWRWCSGWDGRG